MLSVRLLSRQGELVGVEAQGHAGWDRPGKDIVCAAASALLRSAVRTLGSRYAPTDLVAQAPGPGQLSFRLIPFPDEWARGVFSTLEQGLKDLEREFPRAIRVERSEEEQRGASHGT